MNLEEFERNVEQIQQLRSELHCATETLRSFEEASGDTFPCYATAGATRRFGHVELLPVPRETVISAARRERSKIVDKLAQLGITVE